MAGTPSITFGCLNNFCKINSSTLALWARILAALPDSRLVLLAEESSQRERLLGFLKGCGIAPVRVTFLNKRPRPQYLQIYHQIDIGLDTLPYNGHTTSLDSLYMGVPVVTLVGETIVGRAGLSQLTNLSLPDFIAHSEDQFASIACAWAADSTRLADLRADLRARMQSSPLMDAPAFARGIGSAFRQMWHHWCAAT